MLGLVTFMSVVHVLAPLPFGFAIWLIAIFIERPRLSSSAIYMSQRMRFLETGKFESLVSRAKYWLLVIFNFKIIWLAG